MSSGASAQDAVHRAANDAYRAGLWIRPAVEDGTKRPWTVDGTWGHERLTTSILKTLYPSRASLGIETGHGGIEAIDFDSREMYDDFTRAAEPAGLVELVARIESGYCDDTPAGGVRWLWRCDQPDGNLKLARRLKRDDERADEHDRVQVLCETRGRGGFAIVAPSNGKTHPTGLPYVRRSGGFATIARVTMDERAALFGLIRSFDEMPKPKADQRQRNNSARPGTGKRPGDDFCARASWASVLEPHGWRAGIQRGDVQQWTRPGKKHGASATTNIHSSDLLYVFSSSTEFDTDRGYSKFAAYAVLNHGGDFEAAARDLAGQGYGEQRERSQQAKPKADAPRVVLAGELNIVRASTMSAKPVTWIREGHLAAGKVTMLVGDPGARKSWYAIDTTARISRGAPWPEGGRAPLGGVLYFTAEDGGADTLIPRLNGCGADTDRVWIISGVGTGDVQRAAHMTDLPAIAHALDETGATGIVLDPLDDLLCGVDTYKNAELRAALIPLVRLAAERGIWILAIAHGTKANVRAIYKAQGSIGYVGVCRVVLGMARDRNDPERSIIASIKNNLGPDASTLAFRIVDGGTAWNSTGVESYTGDDLWAEPSKGSERVQDAVTWLRDLLMSREADGVPSEQIAREATEAGISRNALWRAKEALYVRARRTGGLGKNGLWLWWLPYAPDEPTDATNADAKSTVHDVHTDRTDRTDSLGNPSKRPKSTTKSPPTRAREDEGEVLL